MCVCVHTYTSIRVTCQVRIPMGSDLYGGGHIFDPMCKIPVCLLGKKI